MAQIDQHLHERAGPGASRPCRAGKTPPRSWRICWSEVRAAVLGVRARRRHFGPRLVDEPGSRRVEPGDAGEIDRHVAGRLSTGGKGLDGERFRGESRRRDALIVHAPRKAMRRVSPSLSTEKPGSATAGLDIARDSALLSDRTRSPRPPPRQKPIRRPCVICRSLMTQPYVRLLEITVETISAEKPLCYRARRQDRGGGGGRDAASGFLYRARRVHALCALWRERRECHRRPRIGARGDRGGRDRAALQFLLPAGAARNALDCALWDLDAKIAGVPAYQLAGMHRLAPCVTAFTLSVGSP